VVDFVRKGHQVMVFVHARNATVRTGLKLTEMANNRGHSQLFLPEDSPQYGQAQKAMSKSRNKQVQEEHGLAAFYASGHFLTNAAETCSIPPIQIVTMLVIQLPTTYVPNMPPIIT
jgi:hypothetical protein